MALHRAVASGAALPLERLLEAGGVPGLADGPVPTPAAREALEMEPQHRQDDSMDSMNARRMRKSAMSSGPVCFGGKKSWRPPLDTPPKSPPHEDCSWPEEETPPRAAASEPLPATSLLQLPLPPQQQPLQRQQQQQRRQQQRQQQQKRQQYCLKEKGDTSNDSVSCCPGFFGWHWQWRQEPLPPVSLVLQRWWELVRDPLDPSVSFAREMTPYVQAL